MAFQNPPANIGSKASESEIWIDCLTTNVHPVGQQNPPKILDTLKATQLIPEFWSVLLFYPCDLGNFRPRHIWKRWDLLRYRVSFRSVFPGLKPVFQSGFCVAFFLMFTSFCVKDHFSLSFFLLFSRNFFGGWHLDKSPVTFCLIGCNRKWKLGGISVSLKMWSWSRFFIAKVFNTPYFNRILVWFGMMLGMKSELMSFGTNLQHPVI